MPIARKEYTCFVCNEIIEKGELYVRMKVQTYSEEENKVKLADICLHDGCYYSDCYTEDWIIGKRLKGEVIIDIVKAPPRV